jgi:tetratricopeptide (TPR) repeat protein
MKQGNKIKFILINLLFLYFVCSLSYSQDAGTESNLSAGFGARAFGLGQAFTGLADDPTAVFWNPAGLEFVYQQTFTLFHTSLPEGTLYDFIGYTYPTLNLGTFGAGIGRIGTGDIPQRDLQDNDLETSCSWEEYQGFFSYAKKLPWDLTPGITMRVIRRAWNNLVLDGNLVDIGVGLDLGLMYKPQFFTTPLLKDWSFGLNVKNLFTPQVKEGITIDELPLSIRFGILRKIRFIGGGNNVNFLMDFNYSEKRDLRIHFGSEYCFRELGMLRAGYNGSSVSFGAGMQYNIFQIDYAFGNSGYSDYFPAVHRISLSFNFGLTRDDLFEIAEAERIAKEERIIAEMREADKRKFVSEHLAKAESYFEEDKYLDAIVEYQQVIGQDPFHMRASAMLDSSNALLQKQFNDQQTLAVQQALDKDRAESDRLFVQEHFDKGLLCLDKKQFTESLIEFNIALERDSGNETILNAISTTKRRLSEEINGLVRQSRREFQNKNYSEALRLLADARLLGADNAKIRTEVETLTQRIKLQENIHQGLLFYDIGEYDKALQVFEEALRIDPENSLVKQYYEKSKIETIGTAEKMDPETERLYLEGVDKFVKGKYQQAIDIWEKILIKHPYNKKVLSAIKNTRDRLKNME